MNYVRNNLEIFIRYAIQQAIVAAVLAILGSLAGFELGDTVASAVSALAQLGWDQLFSPSPPTPAGDLTPRVIRTWASHVAEVELPRLAGVTPALSGSDRLRCRLPRSGGRRSFKQSSGSRQPNPNPFS